MYGLSLKPEQVKSSPYPANSKLSAVFTLRGSDIDTYLISNQVLGIPWSNNNLTSLPNEIVKLKKLKDLYAIDNRLKNLPKNIELMTSLSDLTVSSNQLTALPENIGLLKNLSSISIMNNLISRLPASLLQKELSITLSFNKLCDISQEERDWLVKVASPKWKNGNVSQDCNWGLQLFKLIQA